MESKELIAELQAYKSALEKMVSRFTRTFEAINIEPDDDPVYRQKILEIRDLLNDGLGPNEYSRHVIVHYRDGLANFTHSPSYKSVENIVGVLGAVIVRLKRDPGFSRAGMAVGRKTQVSPKQVFIGHGHSPIWKDLKDFLRDRLKLECVEFNSEPAAGKSNKERLEEMLELSGFALIVMTGEDHATDGMRARENVVHEAGLFQGRLGFERAIILREEGCEEFSNIQGLIQIKFPRGDIMAVSEQVRQTLEREGLLAG